jgi:hypothetical protein
VLRRELADHGRAEALAEVDQALGRHAGVLQQEAPGGAHVQGQPVLGGTARIAAVAAVVEEQDRQPGLVQGLGQAGAMSTVAGVAARHEDGGGVVVRR